MQNPSKTTKNNSQGIIFVMISCQRVRQAQEKRSKRTVPEKWSATGLLLAKTRSLMLP